ncbi:PREDICTED: receptor-type tyrosine-protein phosphatase S-like [Amphimedon queenslandica]|uniref:Tyrosine-protein phosphatase domain-containing protein n=1 Tax=Amphimedon queenslandica TaxID=400682 RepID=A0AAN0JFZ4_AMPQE|nr:PREDICTED: receptor-type tyrosine-protein phosphatase S-like [Amphimedon queenslandica]|eukprot:XP_019855563.1 PREDICTED: receptor-type tyrosine-protein phosphatase S-like [Amphimedon queenslandica]
MFVGISFIFLFIIYFVLSQGSQNIIRPDPSVMKDAFNPNNSWKNREGAGLPFDFNRVPLSKGSMGNTYINASFVGCLGRTAEYILTQHPLADTSMDFWKMMLERHVNVLVVLGSVEEEDEYWPDSEPLEWYEEDITVTLTDRDEFKNIKASNLEIESDMNESHQALTMFQISNWPSDGTTPNDHFTIIELIENIHEIKTGLVAVHTAAGHEEASGVFAVLCSLIPYISVSSKINVMEAVRRTNQQRPGCITTRDQYEYIYETIIASLSDKKRQ